MEELHPDILKAVENGASLSEVIAIENIIDVYGSMAEFSEIMAGIDLIEEPTKSNK